MEGCFLSHCSKFRSFIKLETGLYSFPAPPPKQKDLEMSSVRQGCTSFSTTYRRKEAGGGGLFALSTVDRVRGFRNCYLHPGPNMEALQLLEADWWTWSPV